MTNEKIIEQLENALGLIKQDGRDWLDDRDIPVLEACIKSLTALDKIRAEIASHCGVNTDYCDSCRFCTDSMGVREILQIIDKYRAESEE